ncbi:MAG: BON domain-containing protein, partial [Hyphomicrobiaceae bacterium]
MRCNPWRWLWGIIPVGILAFLTTQWEHDRIETDLRQRSETALSTANLRWATTAFDGRDALITGQATADDAAERARRVVRDVWGVRIADARTHLLPEVKPYQWGASLRGNRIRLSGYVPSDDMRSSIVGMTKATFPKSEIDDKLELARGAPDSDSWLGGISFAMRQLVLLKNGAVNLRDNALSVEGEAAGFAEYKTVKGALRNSLPTGVTLAADNVQPPVASPYNWSVKRTANQIVLSGHVPDEGVREQIFSFAKTSFPRLAIVDRLETAQGAPQGFTMLARVAIEQLVPLSNGEVKLTDKRVSLVGEAPDQATATAVVTGFRAAAKGFDASDTVTFPKPKPPVAAPFVIRADAGAREVVLTGSVPSDEARAELLATVRKRFPGRPVTDRMQLASGEPANWWQCFDAGLAHLAKLGSGVATMSDAALDLTGVTSDEAVSAKLPADLRAAANRACETTASIRYDAPPEPELTWRASHDGVGTVVLEGEVPSEETRDALLQSAAKLFPKANIVDRMKVASGNATKWQSISLLGLKLLASLRKGEAVISRQELTIGGEAKDAAVQTAIRDNLARSVAAPYKSRDAVEVRSDAMIWSENEAKRKAEEKLANERAEAERRAQAAESAEAEKARAAAE